MAQSATQPRKCPACKGLLGDLDPHQPMHDFCTWARPSDWAALAPYFSGDLVGVHAAGA